MRDKILFGLIATAFLFALTIGLTSAEPCGLSAKLINQDPYPAIPGEYAKVVFQLDGLGNPVCGNVIFEIEQEFPFSLDPGSEYQVSVKGGQVSDFGSYLLVPYKLRVNEEAVDGDNKITVRYATKQKFDQGVFTKQDFNIKVEDLRTDFEVSIKDYVSSTNTLTFEILNIGKHDVEALTIEIPKQDNIDVKGSSRNIVGSLDSNEDTTFSFEAVPRNGKIDIVVVYTDKITERRQLQKSLVFDSDYFSNRARDSGGTGVGTYVIVILILGVIAWYFWRRKKRRDAHRRKHLHHG